ncbi:hotdog fold thioesterase [Alicyclobacillus fastidiosus]|uniref:Hotdog fold thioesterase n=1 Tax=Alicyclobacillus fastidiosus TaxID=392011 RepID=A0ABY6ZD66_9BACL|nr:hotdog fold thioesterase [Alicyclobacillus fastidiosus]WAH40782.1 hotdog fold thioesterase [Alicyclobacillus fastidiosus]GMA62257.1 esterase [Alicyclobacillus fastidiosus]
MKELLHNTLMELLGMEVIEATPDKVVMTMPVDARTHQPMGLLHGGASVALAESAASLGSLLNVNTDEKTAVGLEINANHIRSARDGIVTAVATPVHRGATTLVWDIRITNERDQLICISRCTVAIIARKAKSESNSRK